MGAVMERAVDRIEGPVETGKKQTRKGAGIGVGKAVEVTVGTALHILTPTFIAHRRRLLKHLPEESSFRKNVHGLRTTANAVEAAGAGVMLMTIFGGPAFLATGATIYLAGRVPGLMSEGFARYSHRRHKLKAA